MNEQIRELVKQAGGHFTKHNLMSNPIQHRESIELWDKNIEKFAELIVRECIQVGGPEDSYTDEWFKAKADSVGKIKQHFGVKE